jgi:small-conductance mechanosensitive channel
MFSCGYPVSAQDDAKTPAGADSEATADTTAAVVTPADATTAEEPPPVSLASIPDERLSFVKTNSEILRRLGDRRHLDSVAAGLDPLEERLEPILEKAGPESASKVDIAELMDLNSTVFQSEQELHSAVEELEDSARKYEEDLSNLQTLTAHWERVETGSEALEAPEELLRQVRQTRQELELLTSKVTERRNEELGVLMRVSALSSEVAAFRAKATDRRREVRRQTLTQAEAPIWRLGWNREGEGFYHHLWIQLRSDWGHLASYCRDNIFRLLLTFFGPLVLVLGFLRRLKAPAKMAASEDSRAALASRIINPSWPIALILSSLIGIWLSPVAPKIYYRILLFLIVIPAATLTLQVLGPAIRTSILALAASLALQPFLAYFELSPLLDRLVLIAQCAVVGSALALGSRSGQWWSLLTGRWNSIVGWLVRMTVVLLGIAILAALFGEIGFARVIRSGVLGSFGFGVVFFAIFRSLDSLADAVCRTDSAQSLRLLRNHPRTVFVFVHRLLATVAFVAWIVASLHSFDMYDEAVAMIGGILNIGLGMGTFEITIGEILAFVLTIMASFLIARIVCLLLDEEFLPRMQMQRGLDYAISTITRYLILLIGFALALFAAGLDLSKATLLAGAFGVGIGFGLQNIVNNFVSGLILLFERPVQVGDAVEVDNVLGEVTGIGIRASTVRTFQGAEVIVPNGDLISKQVVNWTLSNRRRRVEIDVGVAYGTDPERVIELLLEVAQSHPDVQEDPEPRVVFTGFGDSSLDFQLRCWVASFEYAISAGSELRVAITRALEDADIEIPFPQRDLHIRSNQADQPDRVAQEPEAATSAASELPTERDIQDETSV